MTIAVSLMLTGIGGMSAWKIQQVQVDWRIDHCAKDSKCESDPAVGRQYIEIGAKGTGRARYDCQGHRFSYSAF